MRSRPRITAGTWFRLSLIFACAMTLQDCFGPSQEKLQIIEEVKAKLRPGLTKDDAGAVLAEKELAYRYMSRADLLSPYFGAKDIGDIDGRIMSIVRDVDRDWICITSQQIVIDIKDDLVQTVQLEPVYECL